MSDRVSLGSWRCRSGNPVDVFLSRSVDGTYALRLEWDRPPPLSAVDQLDYDVMILPAVIRRAQEFTERPGRVLVVRV